jgi:hypothetical protein
MFLFLSVNVKLNASGSRRRSEFADVHLDARPKRLVRGPNKLASNLFVDIGLAAIVADLSRDAFNYQGYATALERHRGFAGPRLAVHADHTFHYALLLSKPGSQRSGAGS